MKTMFVAPSNSLRQFADEPPITVAQYFEQLQLLMTELPYQAIEQCLSLLLRAFHEERTIFVFGNGGSAASASHLACDLSRVSGDPSDQRRMKVMALTDNVPLLTAHANDQGYETVFAEQLRTFVQPGDVAFAISCSGESPNVVLALKTARDAGAMTVALTVFDGGLIKRLCDVCVVIPSNNMQMIEDVHHAVLHSISAVLRLRSGSRHERGLSMVAGHGE
jgi:D-sedoheptulose 7-phosphate isomerase